jgi:hypothetical protein
MSDPVVLQVGADPGSIKNSFTGIRAVFPNVAIHTVISEDFLPFRMALCRRTEFQTPGLWEGPLVTFVQQWLTRISESIRQITAIDELPVDSPLTDRVEALNAHVARMVDKGESLESIANDPRATHGDLMLQPANPRTQTLTFDYTGNHPDFPQPTPGRFKDSSARVLITGLDLLVVEMTNSPSSNATRTVNRHDSALWIGWLADLYNVARFAATNSNPYVPEALQRSQYDSIWNADGAFDPKANQGDGQQGEQTSTSPATPTA